MGSLTPLIPWWLATAPAEAKPTGARSTRVANTPTTTPRAPIRPTPSPGVREIGTEYIEGSPYLPTGPQLLPSTPENPSSPIDDLEALPLPPGRIDWEEDPQFSFIARELFPEQYRSLRTLGEVKGIVSDTILQNTPIVSSLPDSAHLIIPEGVYDNAWDIFSKRNGWVWDKETLWVSNSQQRWEALVLAMETYLERRKEGYSLALEFEEKTEEVPLPEIKVPGVLDLQRYAYTLGNYEIEYRYDEVVEIPGSRETIEEILFPSVDEPAEGEEVEEEGEDWLEKLFPPQCDPENPLSSIVASSGNDGDEGTNPVDPPDGEGNPNDPNESDDALGKAVTNFDNARGDADEAAEDLDKAHSELYRFGYSYAQGFGTRADYDPYFEKFKTALQAHEEAQQALREAGEELTALLVPESEEDAEAGSSRVERIKQALALYQERLTRAEEAEEVAREEWREDRIDDATYWDAENHRYAMQLSVEWLWVLLGHNGFETVSTPSGNAALAPSQSGQGNHPQFCETCGRAYRPFIEFCFDDGTPLRPLDPEKDNITERPPPTRAELEVQSERLGRYIEILEGDIDSVEAQIAELRMHMDRDASNEEGLEWQEGTILGECLEWQGVSLAEWLELAERLEWREATLEALQDSLDDSAAKRDQINETLGRER